MNLPNAEATMKTLANANELTCAIAQGVVGNEIADTVGGTPLTRDMIFQLAQSQFQSRLSKYLGN